MKSTHRLYPRALTDPLQNVTAHQHMRDDNRPSGGRVPSGLSTPTGRVNELSRTLYLYPVNTPGVTITNNGGPIVGSSPLQLLFWGSFWDTAVNPSVYDIIKAVQTIITSPYLSELNQYGFQQLSYGGARTVHQPGASYPTFSYKQVYSMIWDLIDDDVFPEPDEDNGRNVYMVFAPQGAVYDQLKDGGAHDAADEQDVWPLDVDYAWVGWVDYGTLDAITTMFTHELVEIITDPEPDNPGWTFKGQPTDNSEIGDICQNKDGNQVGLVGGYGAAAYYSERLKACVVPSNVLPRTVKLNQEVANGPIEKISEGEKEFPPSHCFKGKYHFVLQGFTQAVTVTADVSSYTSPVITWQINDATANNGPLVVPAEFSDTPTTTATVEILVNNTSIVLSSEQQPPTSLKVTCAVKESNVPDAYGLQRTSEMRVELSGQEIVINDPRYWDDLNKCLEERMRISKLALEKSRSVIDLVDPAPRWLNDVRIQSLPNQQRVELEQAFLLARNVRSIDVKLFKELNWLAERMLFFYSSQRKERQ